MDKIRLNTHNKNEIILSIVDDAFFEEINSYSWFPVRQKKNTYAGRWVYVNGTKLMILMHRQILATPVGFVTDHKNGNGLDNRVSNLRIATVSQNAANITSQINTSSNYLGVSYESKRGKWRAAICKDKRNILIGRFDNEKAAAMAYNEAALRLHGNFASLNIM